MSTFNEIGTNSQKHHLYRDQLLTVQDLIEFKEQLIIDIEKLLKNHDGESNNQWLKACEVRKMLRLSEGKLQYLRDKGVIPFKKLGGVTYYDKNEIQEMMRSGRFNEQLKFA